MIDNRLNMYFYGINMELYFYLSAVVSTRNIILSYQLNVFLRFHLTDKTSDWWRVWTLNNGIGSDIFRADLIWKLKTRKTSDISDSKLYVRFIISRQTINGCKGIETLQVLNWNRRSGGTNGGIDKSRAGSDSCQVSHRQRAVSGLTSVSREPEVLRDAYDAVLSDPDP